MTDYSKLVKALRDTERAAEGGRMTQREILVEDKQGVETILCAMEGIGPELTDKVVILAICRCLWHILDYMIRRCGNV